jgi:hypothetical protein
LLLRNEDLIKEVLKEDNVDDDKIKQRDKQINVR